MLPRYDVADSVLIPGLRLATSLKGMFGYFTSGVLVDLAPGLAEYLERRDTQAVRLVVSPAILAEDFAAIREGTTTKPAIVERRLIDLLGSDQVTESALAHHTLQCLAWLLASQRLDVRVAFLTYRYHPKVWLLSDSSGTICARGSGNATGAALHGNIENLDVDCSWIDGSARKVKTFLDEFDLQWNDQSDLMDVYPLADAVRNEWLSRYTPTAPPTPTDFDSALQEDRDAGLVRPPPGTPPARTVSFRIPPGIIWRTGRYRHQGEAVDAFEAAGRRGVFEMATGAGKTIAALIAANRIYRDQGRLLIVVTAPTTALVLQWAEEARRFGLDPVLPTTAHTRKDKFHRIDTALRRLRHKSSNVECLVVTNHLLKDPVFQTKLAAFGAISFLVADEVHNLGASRFISNPPDFFTSRLGLSATPVRQFDEPGTAKLFQYFGGVVYRFGLDHAIGICLVPYDYYLHDTHFTESELEEWVAITQRIAANRWRDEDDDYLQGLYRRRRAVVENAESKVPVLRSVLEGIGPRFLQNTLVYTSSKNPAQLQAVLDMLAHLNIRFHRITEHESSDTHLLEGLFDAFRSGALQVLVAKKVLDEGVNLPTIQRAFILASTTVEREWVQRRGRVLRRAPGKDHAVIHDFLVIPPDLGTEAADVRSLIRSELDRIEAFADLARNAAAVDGALAVYHRLVLRYFTNRSAADHDS